MKRVELHGDPPVDRRAASQASEPILAIAQATGLLVLALGARHDALVLTSLGAPYFAWHLRSIEPRKPGVAIGILLIATATSFLIVTALNDGSLLFASAVLGAVAHGILLGLEGDKQRMTALRMYSTAVLALSCAWVVLNVSTLRRSWGTSDVAGWTAHRNLFAYALALAIVPTVTGVATGSDQSRSWGKFARAMRATILCVLVLSTGSAGALAVTCSVLVVAAMFLRRDTARTSLTLGRTAVLVSVVGLAVANLALVTRLVGRDRTLTGRTELWAALTARLTDYVAIGDGPGTNWRGWSTNGKAGEPAPLTREVWEAVGDRVTNAHNTVLELVITFGGLVAVGITGALVISIWRAVGGAGGAHIVILGTWVASTMVAESFVAVPQIMVILCAVAVMRPNSLPVPNPPRLTALRRSPIATPAA